MGNSIYPLTNYPPYRFLSHPYRFVAIFPLPLRHIQRVALGIDEVREAAGLAFADDRLGERHAARLERLDRFLDAAGEVQPDGHAALAIAGRRGRRCRVQADGQAVPRVDGREVILVALQELQPKLFGVEAD